MVNGDRVFFLVSRLISHFEGCRLAPYDDATGHQLTSIADCKGTPTIGWGHAFPPSDWPIYKIGITQAKADSLLRADLEKARQAVEKRAVHHHVPVTGEWETGEMVALTDFAFNCGEGALDQLLSHSDPANQFERWNHDNGQVKEGLTKRRAVEAFLFSLGEDA
jgi:GH24 family phage-related lysozyme (muramidase)